MIEGKTIVEKETLSNTCLFNLKSFFSLGNHQSQSGKTSTIFSCVLGSLEYDALNKNYRNENLFISGIKYIFN